MPEPADVNGELLCFRAGKQHAEIQCVQKSCIVDPAFFLDQFGMHHRDLTAWSAEGYEAELQPKPKGFTKRWRNMSILRWGACHSGMNGTGVCDSFDSDQVCTAKRFFIFEQ